MLLYWLLLSLTVAMGTTLELEDPPCVSCPEHSCPCPAQYICVEDHCGCSFCEKCPPTCPCPFPFEGNVTIDQCGCPECTHPTYEEI